MRWGAVATLVLVVGVAVSRAHADGVVIAARAEAGGEYDSNPSRVETFAGAPSPLASRGSGLARVVLAADAAAPLGERQLLTLSLGAAGKRFFADDARREDVGILEASAAWRYYAGETTQVVASGGYFDVFQRAGATRRDFRSVSPAGRIDRSLGGGVLSAGGGYRLLVYKPDASYTFAGPTALLAWRRAVPAPLDTDDPDWEVSASSFFEWRGFQGARCADANTCDAAGGLRRDIFAGAQLDVVRTSRILLGGGLGVHVNRSNSYGETLWRGLLRLRATAPLPARFVVNARSEASFTRYRDAVPLARSVTSGTPLASIEDEGASTLRVEVLRSLGDAVDVGLRFSWYTNALAGGPVDYDRETLLLFVAGSYGR